VIALADGTYRGNFQTSRSGTAADPITVIGSRAAILDGGSLTDGYALHLDHASYWSLNGFSVTGASKGIMLDASRNTVMDGLDVGNTGQEGIHLRNFTQGATIRNCVIHDTGLVSPGYGEGIYIGTAQDNWKSVTGGEPDASDGNSVLGNTIVDTAAESIDIKEGTSGGTVQGNVLGGAKISGKNSADSYLDVKGNGYMVSGNRFTDANAQVTDAIQTHVIVTGAGSGNTFSGNILATDIPGYLVNVQLKGTATNRVLCDNQATGAAAGLSNIACG
jgi:hypothetical protein